MNDCEQAIDTFTEVHLFFRVLSEEFGQACELAKKLSPVERASMAAALQTTMRILQNPEKPLL